jgi:hypothetical protein
LGHGDDKVRPSRCVFGEPCEALAELRGRVFPCHDEQVVKGGDRMTSTPSRHSLIQSVEQFSAERDCIEQQAPAAVVWDRVVTSAEETMRPVRPPECLPSVRVGEAVQYLTAIDTDSGQLRTYGIGCVQRDGQALL